LPHYLKIKVWRRVGNGLQHYYAEKLHNLSPTQGQKDPKTRLQELMQAKKLELPVYELLSMSGLAHEQTFKVQCKISFAPRALPWKRCDA
jgi:ribonuclease-3